MIHIENLKFGYRKNFPVFDGIDLRLGAGAITGLLGKNGVGKTTLLHLISGLRRPDGGTVAVMGSTPHCRGTQFLSQVCLLSEEMPQSTLTIEAFAKANGYFYPHFSEEEFLQFLSDFEITDTRQKISSLSLGTHKKVLIAFALATNARLILMDEPTNGLDIPSKAVFRKLVLSKVEDDRLILISTHQVRDLQNILNSVVILNEKSVLLNADTYTISQRLFFGIADGSENPDDVLYSEPSVAGTQIVRVNTNGEESNVDTELLFNAVFASGQKINQLFNQNKEEM